MISLAILVLCVSAAVQTDALIIKHIPCKDTTSEGEVTTLDLSPCESDPCHLAQGSTYTITVNLTTGASPAEVAAIHAMLYGIIAGVKVEFPGFNQTDACTGCNLVCPLSAHSSHSYKLSLYVDPKKTIPIDIVAEIELKDLSSGIDLMCEEVEIVVVRANEPLKEE